VERIADHVIVMYRGRVMEEASTASLIRSPQHPYTRALLSAVPSGRPGERRDRVRLLAEPPSPTAPLSGCPFSTRCPQVQAECKVKIPRLERKPSGHRVACPFV
jgi:oligopeptide/dipeptide ABC transporter ATP-binding protein